MRYAIVKPAKLFRGIVVSLHDDPPIAPPPMKAVELRYTSHVGEEISFSFNTGRFLQHEVDTSGT